MPDQCQVVRDEEVGDAAPALHVAQQVDDLGLDRHVQRRYRLVADDDHGLDRQGAGNRHALALAARQLVRIAVEMLLGQPHLGQELGHPPAPVAAGAQAMDAQGVAHRVGDPAARVQAGIGVLEDDLHAAAEAHGVLAQHRRRILPLQQEAAGAGRHQPCQAVGERGLAAAGFADHCQRLARLDGQRHPVQRVHHTAAASHPARDREALG
ncbi:hypothetical protein STHU_33650 [Allostella humosa]|nr:hypothetical protein STHU_33650 [Stella humosa]